MKKAEDLKPGEKFTTMFSGYPHEYEVKEFYRKNIRYNKGDDSFTYSMSLKEFNKAIENNKIILKLKQNESHNRRTASQQKTG